MKIEAVIFDMDGLMFDTERLHRDFWKQVERESGLHFLDGLPDMTGMNVPAIAEIYHQRYGDAVDYFALRAKHRRLMTDYMDRQGVPVKEGLYELIGVLEKNGIPCALATSTYRKDAVKLLQKTGLDTAFAAMVFGDEVQRSKPDPEIFLIAAERLHVSPSRTLVLEDSVNGATAGCNGGFPTVMVPDQHQPTQELRLRLTAEFSSLLDVIPFLQKVWGEAERPISESLSKR